MNSYNEDYRKPVYQGKYFFCFFFFFFVVFFQVQKIIEMVQKSCFCQLFNNFFVCSDVDIFFACFRNRFFNFIIYDVFTDNFRTGIGINMKFFATFWIMIQECWVFKMH